MSTGICDTTTATRGPPGASRDESERTYWVRIRDSWRRLDPALRRSYISAAAETLKNLWRNGADLERVPPELWAWTSAKGSLRLELPLGSYRDGPRRMRPAELIRVLGQWHMRGRETLSASEELRFVRIFLDGESIDRHSFHYFLRRVVRSAERQAAAEAAAAYRRFLEQAPAAGGNGVSGVWKPLPLMPPRDLLKRLEEAETGADTVTLKSSDKIRVFQTSLLGIPVVVKRYDLPGGLARLKYYARPSRARRAWAAGETLRAMGIPTPESLGFIEIRRRGLPVRSFWITAFLENAPSVYRWTKAHYARQPHEWRAGFRRDLRAALLALYRNGLYHGDTKSPNLLVTDAADPDKRRLYWTDLESLVAGVTPTPRMIVRNLVQLNGSFRRWVPDEDRFLFLSSFSRYYPWLRQPDVVERMRKWTQRRLLNELYRHTPPEGHSHRNLGTRT